jgi:HipA N-terminal domain
LTREYTNDECLPFFSGLLPDGRIRDRIADLAHVSSSSTVRLLEQYGSDVAGALSILAEDDTVTTTGLYQPLAEEEIARRLENMSVIPLLRAGRNIRLSLAGAENKIPLYIEDGRFFFRLAMLLQIQYLRHPMSLFKMNTLPPGWHLFVEFQYRI